MKDIVIINTRRSEYSAELAAEKSLTVGELIDILEQYDENALVVTGHDNGYTYGHLSYMAIELKEDEY